MGRDKDGVDGEIAGSNVNVVTKVTDCKSKPVKFRYMTILN